MYQPLDVHSHLLHLHATQRLIKAEYGNLKSLQDTLRPLSEFARLPPHKLAKVEGALHLLHCRARAGESGTGRYMNGALLHISLFNTSDLQVCPQLGFKCELGECSCSTGTWPPGSGAVQTGPQILILFQKRKRRGSETAGYIWPPANLRRKAS